MLKRYSYVLKSDKIIICTKKLGLKASKINVLYTIIEGLNNANSSV